ncbi:MAG: imidazolonepropionase [Planctomycetes bacterium]|nr:imidazolonepropionase [Planctomycetota bacterium]
MRSYIPTISQLIAIPPGPVAGSRMRSVPIIEGAAIVVNDGKIEWFGKEADAPKGPFDTTIDAAGACVTPGLVDCHTHVVFAGDRAGEFVQRIGGATYAEIMQAGGGIRSSVRALRVASEDDLVAQSLPRLNRMIAGGATTIEIKSGYGLSPADELKTLRAIRRLAGMVSADLVPTFLGAHTVPPEFDGRPDDYLVAITDPALLDAIRDERLAEFADVFCERGAFTVDQSRRFLSACKSFGMTPKVHADQLTRSGATALAVELGAASADHLEFANDADIAALKASRTIPVLLPGCNFFIGGAPAPARKMLDADLPVALATDCNPGSCMIESLGMIMSIAATMLKMTPLESLVACTANAAAALRREKRIGAIAVDHDADLLILDIPRIELWPYHVGVNPVRTIVKGGVPVLTN